MEIGCNAYKRIVLQLRGARESSLAVPSTQKVHCSLHCLIQPHGLLAAWTLQSGIWEFAVRGTELLCCTFSVGTSTRDTTSS